MFTIKSNYWNCKPSREQRKQQNHRILSDAYDRFTQKFTFRIGNRIVCEWAYLRILGLVSATSVNKPEQWVNNRNKILNGNAVTSNVPEDKKATVSKKLDHAVIFIKYLAEIFAEPGYFDNAGIGNLDKRPEIMLEDSSIANSQQKVLYLPYDHSKEVYTEYKAFYQDEEENAHPDDKFTCGISTFRAALALLKNEIKLRSAKGILRLQ